MYTRGAAPPAGPLHKALYLLRLHIVDEEGIDECRKKHYQCNTPENDRTIYIPQRTHLPLDCEWNTEKLPGLASN